MNSDGEISKILKSRPSTTDMVNVMEVLSYSQNDFQKAFDIALEMENKDLVKLVYSNFNQGKVIVEFTLLGKSI